MKQIHNCLFSFENPFQCVHCHIYKCKTIQREKLSFMEVLSATPTSVLEPKVAFQQKPKSSCECWRS